MQPSPDAEFFKPGDWVVVMEGVFSGEEGEVVQFARERGIVRVELDVDGQRVLAEFEMSQVELV